MPLGTMKVCHIAFVVKDIEGEMEKWAMLLGIEKPRIWNIPGPEVAPTLTNDQIERYQNCRISVIEFENLVMEVVQPGEEPSPWKTHLQKHGEGFQHISFVVPDKKAAYQAISDSCGVNEFYHIGYYPGMSYAFFDTYDMLKTELNIKIEEDNTAIIKTILEKIEQ